MVLFQELSSSPATTQAIKAAGAFGSMEGNTIQQADAIHAYTQSKLGGTATWVRLPREAWPPGQRVDAFLASAHNDSGNQVGNTQADRRPDAPTPGRSAACAKYRHADMRTMSGSTCAGLLRWSLRAQEPQTIDLGLKPGGDALRLRGSVARALRCGDDKCIASFNRQSAKKPGGKSSDVQCCQT